MFKQTEYSGKNVIFLPNYIVSVLRAHNMTLSDFENIMIYSNNKPELTKTLLDKMSKYDLMDFYVSNMVLNNALLGEDNHGSFHNAIKWDISDIINDELQVDNLKTTPYTVMRERYKDVINNLSDTECILMSSNNENETFTFETSEQTLFVILHNGFTDLTVKSNRTVLHDFMRVLVNKMFNVFGDEHTMSHSLFKAYLKSCLIK